MHSHAAIHFMYFCKSTQILIIVASLPYKRLAMGTVTRQSPSKEEEEVVVKK